MICSNCFLVFTLIIILYFAGASDADSDAANITFILLNDEATGANPLGYVLQRKRPITRFSQQDLQQGTLFFAHHGKEITCDLPKAKVSGRSIWSKLKVFTIWPSTAKVLCK